MLKNQDVCKTLFTCDYEYQTSKVFNASLNVELNKGRLAGSPLSLI